MPSCVRIFGNGLETAPTRRQRHPLADASGFVSAGAYPELRVRKSESLRDSEQEYGLVLVTADGSRRPGENVCILKLSLRFIMIK